MLTAEKESEAQVVLCQMAEPIGKEGLRVQRPMKMLLTFGTHFYDDLCSKIQSVR